jgi:hypothetical protein
MGKTCTEASDVSGKRGFIPVGWVGGCKLVTLKQSRTVPDLIGRLLASGIEGRGPADILSLGGRGGGQTHCASQKRSPVVRLLLYTCSENDTVPTPLFRVIVAYIIKQVT